MISQLSVAHANPILQFISIPPINLKLIRRLITILYPLMEKTDKIALYQEFLRMVDERANLIIKGNLEAFLDYAEYSIKSEFDKGGKKNIKHKKRKDQFKQRFLQAYNSQSPVEKLEEYIRIIRFLKDLKQGNEPSDNLQGEKRFTDAHCLSYNLHLWKKKQLRLNMTKGQMFCEKDNKIKFYDLKNYLIRESKNTDYRCFVLEAINTQPHHKSLVVRIGFKDLNKFKECYELVKATVIKMQRVRIKEELGIVTSPPSTIYGANTPSTTSNNSSSVSSLNTSVNSQVKQGEKEEYVPQQSPTDSKLEEEMSDRKTFRSQVNQGEESNEEDQQIETIAMSLLACDNNEEMYSIEEKELEAQNEKKKNLDVFHQIVPDYELESLIDDTGFELIHTQGNGNIFHSSEENSRYKIIITVEQPSSVLLFQALARVENYTKWNPAIQEVMIKSILRSENVAIIYQKHKPMSKIYRARDFVFMRHVFKMNGNLYMVDKSIQNASYPPFLTIVRGQLQIIWGIIKKGSEHIIAADIQIQNQGYINQTQNHNLAMLYLKGLMKIQEYLKNPDVVEVQWEIFDLGWDISHNHNKKNKFQAKFLQSGQKAFKKAKGSQPNLSENPKSSQLIGQNSQRQKTSSKTDVQKPRTQSASPQKVSNQESKKQNKKSTEISPDPRQKQKPQEKPQNHLQVIKVQNKSKAEKPPTNPKQEQQEMPQVTEVLESPKDVHTSINYQFDSKGLVVIPQQYLKARYSFSPEPPKPMVYQQAIQGHPIWKGQWKFDTKYGGIIFINQQKINDQKGVIKFILSKIAKNLLSGKSILNISLPVDIFGYQTNLERLALAMTYAPIILQKAVAEKDPIEKLKLIAGFGLTNSAIYLSMQKPFNSILGETFQGWMNGCPIYMEQISHHPPIAAFMLLGRGYKLTGCLQSKVEVHMNSGCGTNEGIYKIVMDDGSDYNFITPGGQISGISYGDRKFNLVGKYYVWSKKHRLFLEITMDPCSRKGFLSKRQHPTDYMEGYLKQVTLQFLNEFQTQKKKEKQGPSKAETIRIVSKADGTWYRSLMFDGKQYLDLDKEVGVKLQYDKYLLPSDGNWREDLAYRRKKDIVRAQTEKERLQNLQRGDRKLREKFHKGKH